MMKKINIAKAGIRPLDKAHLCITKLRSGKYDIVIENHREIAPALGVDLSQILRWTRPGAERKMFQVLDLCMHIDRFDTSAPSFKFTISMKRAMRLMGGVFKKDTEVIRATVAPAKAPSVWGKMMAKGHRVPRNQRRRNIMSKKEMAQEVADALLGRM